MICKNCGNILRDDVVVCDQCGAEVSSPRTGTGTDSRRQGKPERPAAGHTGGAMDEAPFLLRQSLEPDAALAGRRRPRSEHASQGGHRRKGRGGSSAQEAPGRKKTHAVHRMMVNWAMVGAVLAVMLVLALAGGLLFLRYTDQGQLILARMGKESSAQALWAYGQELLDQGYVSRSIETFEQAYAMEPDREDIYQRLQQLADAYEAGERFGDAERVYRQLTELEPANPLGYQAVVRLMQNQNRMLELASFLKTAYEQTGEVSFRRQREDMIPSTPTASIQAGSLMREQDVALLSSEDYEIYYLLDSDGELPEAGQRYESPIHLNEGVHTLRAVALSNELISDELNIKYTIMLPEPSAPVTSLAPGTYNKRYSISLRYVESEDEQRSDDPKQKQITIYYTIDGQTPNSNSPIFDGEPFQLPLGSCVVKAVAVNGYGKVSNVMERSFKVSGSFKRYFNNEDEFADFTILKTTRDAFVKKFGAPATEEPVEEPAMKGACIRLRYAWGEARFTMMETGYMLYAVDTTQSTLSGPRKTKIGMSETDITEKYRDMGQAHDQNGDRSIYWDKDSKDYAKLYHLDATHDRIDYVYHREDGGLVTLSYYLENSRVNRMAMKCTY